MSCKDNHNPNIFSLLHYNIKELRTEKLNNPKSEQVKSLREFLLDKEFDILSINEIEYAPTNLQKINVWLKDKEFISEVFIKANTGNKSTKDKADLVNYGSRPGEYSTGALTKFKVFNKIILDDLKWKDFFKNEDFSTYKISDGSSIPETIELFDKSFSDTTLMINKKQVHLILLHTVPAYGFGNEKSINFLRNQRQLEFLKWYLNPDGKSKIINQIMPLKQNSYFIVVGDLNIDFKKEEEGAKVLNSILNHFNTWIPIRDMDYTHKNPKLMLDYIILSKNIIPLKGKIFKDVKDIVSDHLPIWGSFRLN